MTTANDGGSSRWEELIQELEGALDAEERSQLAAEVADRSRREWSEICLVDRLGPQLGSEVALQVTGAGPVVGVLRDIGPDWVLLKVPAGRSTLVPLRGVLSVRGVGRWTTPRQGFVFRRLRLTYALRAVARDRRGLLLALVDGSTAAGTLDRVGADFIEVAEHPGGEPRRAAEVRQVRAFPLDALAAIHSG